MLTSRAGATRLTQTKATDRQDAGHDQHSAEDADHTGPLVEQGDGKADREQRTGPPGHRVDHGQFADVVPALQDDAVGDVQDRGDQGSNWNLGLGAIWLCALQSTMAGRTLRTTPCCSSSTGR